MTTSNKKSLVLSLATAAVLSLSSLTGAMAADYPIKKPKSVDWSFAGPFGKWDKGQLQRGLKVYQEVCAACHSLKYIAYRNLQELGYTEDQVKALAAEIEVEDGPDADGEMFTRPGRPADYFPEPFANAQQAAASNNGAAPPDLSLIAKARAPGRGFPTFIFDIFTQYAEAGPDYVYSLLTGYNEKPKEGVEVGAGTYYNPYFLGGATLSMAPPLSDGLVSYDDGSPETVDQYAKDFAAFAMWAAEPHLETRKKTGFRVMIFLLIFATMLYLTKRRVWSRIEH